MVLYKKKNSLKVFPNTQVWQLTTAWYSSPRASNTLLYTHMCKVFSTKLVLMIEELNERMQDFGLWNPSKFGLPFALKTCWHRQHVISPCYRATGPCLLICKIAGILVTLQESCWLIIWLLRSFLTCEGFLRPVPEPLQENILRGPFHS